MPKTILVVDDRASLRNMVKEYLTEQGFRVVTAADGQQALFLAREEKPEGLHRVPPCEAVGAEVFAPFVREGLHEEPVGGGEARDVALEGKPFGGMGGEVGPALLPEHREDALGQLG